MARLDKRSSTQVLTRGMNRDEARRTLDAQGDQSGLDAAKGRSIALLAKTWFACGSLRWQNTVSGGTVTSSLQWSSTMNGSGSSSAFTYDTPPTQISAYSGPLILTQFRSGTPASANTYQCRPTVSGNVVTLNLYDSTGAAVNQATTTFDETIDVFLFFPVVSYAL